MRKCLSHNMFSYPWLVSDFSDAVPSMQWSIVRNHLWRRRAKQRQSTVVSVTYIGLNYIWHSVCLSDLSTAEMVLLGAINNKDRLVCLQREKWYRAVLGAAKAAPFK